MTSPRPPQIDECRESDPSQIAQSLKNIHISSAHGSSSTWGSQNAPTEFDLCDSDDSFQSAISMLRDEIDSSRARGGATSLILDCEGLNLGEDGGVLSLICLCTCTPTTTPTSPRSPNCAFLFDIVVLKQKDLSMEPLFDLLTSPDIRKILYDGRMDFCSMYHQHGVELTNVIDLQLADVKSRFVRGETRERQSQRLMRSFFHNQVHNPRNAYKYDQIHQLQGLGPCLSEHQLSATKSKGFVNHDQWLDRPLSLEHLQYAANDLVLIDALHTSFHKSGYLDNNLPAQSQRYISIWSDALPRPNDVYRAHPLLPLEILFYDPTLERKVCNGCARSFCRTSFPQRDWPSEADGRRRCWVCLAVPFYISTRQRREEIRKKQKEEKGNEELKRGEATAALFRGSPNPVHPPGRGDLRDAVQSPNSSHLEERGRGRGWRGMYRGRGGRGFGPSFPDSGRQNMDSEWRGKNERGRGRGRARGRGNGTGRGRLGPDNTTIRGGFSA